MQRTETDTTADSGRGRAGEHQLALLDRPARNWRLDERTRELGRRGLAMAREALREASARDASSRRAA
jgi:hypothetical protein